MDLKLKWRWTGQITRENKEKRIKIMTKWQAIRGKEEDNIEGRKTVSNG